MTRVRRRESRRLSPAGLWEQEREFALSGSIGAGLGIRPEGWWIHESGRPDLAADADLDAYAHLRAEFMPKAAERLCYLALSGQLTRDELAAIAARATPAHAWRAAVLERMDGRRRVTWEAMPREP